MIDREHDLPITRQAKVLQISRGSVYYQPRPVSASDLEVMRRLDRLHLEFPFAGSRMLQGLLVADGCKIGRRHVKTLMRRMGIEALYRRPRTTKPEPGLKTTPVGPQGTATVSACLRPFAAYSVLEPRASFAIHHGPVGLAARPHALTSCGSARSVTRRCTVNDASTRPGRSASAASTAANTMLTP